MVRAFPGKRCFSDSSVLREKTVPFRTILWHRSSFRSVLSLFCITLIALQKDKAQMLTPFRFMQKDGSIPYHFMALFYGPFRSLTVLQKTKRKRSHRTTIVVRRRGDVMAVSSAQASDPDNQRTCAFVCFSILRMRSSAKLIPYGAVLNRCMYRAVMNRTVSRSRMGVQP